MAQPKKKFDSPVSVVTLAILAVFAILIQICVAQSWDNVTPTPISSGQMVSGDIHACEWKYYSINFAPSPHASTYLDVSFVANISGISVFVNQQQLPHDYPGYYTSKKTATIPVNTSFGFDSDLIDSCSGAGQFYIGVKGTSQYASFTLIATFKEATLYESDVGSSPTFSNQMLYNTNSFNVYQITTNTTFGSPISSSSLHMIVGTTNVQNGQIAVSINQDRMAGSTCALPLLSPDPDYGAGYYRLTHCVLQPNATYYITVRATSVEDEDVDFFNDSLASSPVTYNLFVFYEDAQVTQLSNGVSAQGKVYASSKEHLRAQYFMLDLSSAAANQRLVVSIRNVYGGQVNLFATPSQLAGSRSCEQIHQYRCSATTATQGNLPSCTVVIDACNFVATQWYFAVELILATSSDSSVSFEVLANAVQVPVVELASGQPVASSINQLQLQSYKLNVANVSSNEWLTVKTFVDYVTGDNDITVFLNSGSAAGNAPCFQSLQSCTVNQQTPFCLLSIDNCDLTVGQWFVAVQGGSSFYYENPVKYSLELTKHAAFPISLGVPVSNQIHQGEYHHYELVISKTPSAGAYFDIELVNKDGGTINYYLNEGSLAGPSTSCCYSNIYGSTGAPPSCFFVSRNSTWYIAVYAPNAGGNSVAALGYTLTVWLREPPISIIAEGKQLAYNGSLQLTRPVDSALTSYLSNLYQVSVSQDIMIMDSITVTVNHITNDESFYVVANAANPATMWCKNSDLTSSCSFDQTQTTYSCVFSVCQLQSALGQSNLLYLGVSGSASDFYEPITYSMSVGYNINTITALQVGISFLEQSANSESYYRVSMSGVAAGGYLVVQLDDVKYGYANVYVSNAGLASPGKYPCRHVAASCSTTNTQGKWSTSCRAVVPCLDDYGTQSDWYITVDKHASGDSSNPQVNYKITASYTTDDQPRALTSSVPLVSSIMENQYQHFYIDVDSSNQYQQLLLTTFINSAERLFNLQVMIQGNTSASACSSNGNAYQCVINGNTNICRQLVEYCNLTPGRWFVSVLGVPTPLNNYGNPLSYVIEATVTTPRQLTSGVAVHENLYIPNTFAHFKIPVTVVTGTYLEFIVSNIQGGSVTVYAHKDSIAGDCFAPNTDCEYLYEKQVQCSATTSDCRITYEACELASGTYFLSVYASQITNLSSQPLGVIVTANIVSNMVSLPLPSSFNVNTLMKNEWQSFVFNTSGSGLALGQRVVNLTITNLSGGQLQVNWSPYQPSGPSTCSFENVPCLNAPGNVNCSKALIPCYFVSDLIYVSVKGIAQNDPGVPISFTINAAQIGFASVTVGGAQAQGNTLNGGYSYYKLDGASGLAGTSLVVTLNIANPTTDSVTAYLANSYSVGPQSACGGHIMTCTSAGSTCIIAVNPCAFRAGSSWFLAVQASSTSNTMIQYSVQAAQSTPQTLTLNGQSASSSVSQNNPYATFTASIPVSTQVQSGSTLRFSVSLNTNQNNLMVYLNEGATVGPSCNIKQIALIDGNAIFDLDPCQYDIVPGATYSIGIYLQSGDQVSASVSASLQAPQTSPNSAQLASDQELAMFVIPVSQPVTSNQVLTVTVNYQGGGAASSSLMAYARPQLPAGPSGCCNDYQLPSPVVLDGTVQMNIPLCNFPPGVTEVFVYVGANNLPYGSPTLSFGVQHSLAAISPSNLLANILTSGTVLPTGFQYYTFQYPGTAPVGTTAVFTLKNIDSNGGTVAMMLLGNNGVPLSQCGATQIATSVGVNGSFVYQTPLCSDVTPSTYTIAIEGLTTSTSPVSFTLYATWKTATPLTYTQTIERTANNSLYDVFVYDATAETTQVTFDITIQSNETDPSKVLTLYINAGFPQSSSCAQTTTCTASSYSNCTFHIPSCKLRGQKWFVTALAPNGQAITYKLYGVRNVIVAPSMSLYPSFVSGSVKVGNSLNYQFSVNNVPFGSTLTAIVSDVVGGTVTTLVNYGNLASPECNLAQCSSTTIAKWCNIGFSACDSAKPGVWYLRVAATSQTDPDHAVSFKVSLKQSAPVPLNLSAPSFGYVYDSAYQLYSLSVERQLSSALTLAVNSDPQASCGTFNVVMYGPNDVCQPFQDLCTGSQSSCAASFEHCAFTSGQYFVSVKGKSANPLALHGMLSYSVLMANNDIQFTSVTPGQNLLWNATVNNQLKLHVGYLSEGSRVKIDVHNSPTCSLANVVAFPSEPAGSSCNNIQLFQCGNNAYCTSFCQSLSSSDYYIAYKGDTVCNVTLSIDEPLVNVIDLQATNLTNGLSLQRVIAYGYYDFYQILPAQLNPQAILTITVQSLISVMNLQVNMNPQSLAGTGSDGCPTNVTCTAINSTTCQLMLQHCQLQSAFYLSVVSSASLVTTVPYTLQINTVQADVTAITNSTWYCESLASQMQKDFVLNIYNWTPTSYVKIDITDASDGDLMLSAQSNSLASSSCHNLYDGTTQCTSGSCALILTCGIGNGPLYINVQNRDTAHVNYKIRAEVITEAPIVLSNGTTITSFIQPGQRQYYAFNFDNMLDYTVVLNPLDSNSQASGYVKIGQLPTNNCFDANGASSVLLSSPCSANGMAYVMVQAAQSTTTSTVPVPYSIVLQSVVSDSIQQLAVDTVYYGTLEELTGQGKLFSVPKTSSSNYGLQVTLSLDGVTGSPVIVQYQIDGSNYPCSQSYAPLISTLTTATGLVYQCDDQANGNVFLQLTTASQSLSCRYNLQVTWVPLNISAISPGQTVVDAITSATPIWHSMALPTVSASSYMVVYIDDASADYTIAVFSGNTGSDSCAVDTVTVGSNNFHVVNPCTPLKQNGTYYFRVSSSSSTNATVAFRVAIQAINEVTSNGTITASIPAYPRELQLYHLAASAGGDAIQVMLNMLGSQLPSANLSPADDYYNSRLQLVLFDDLCGLSASNLLGALATDTAYCTSEYNGGACVIASDTRSVLQNTSQWWIAVISSDSGNSTVLANNTQSYSMTVTVGRNDTCADYYQVRDQLTFCTSVITYPVKRHHDYAALDQQASNLYNKLVQAYMTLWNPCSLSSFAATCGVQLKQLACYESFRRCDDEGRISGVCRYTCKSVITQCLQDPSHFNNLAQYNCLSNRYDDSNTTCTPGFNYPCDPSCDLHGFCNNGVCQCLDGWTGPNCEYQPGCPFNCSDHGKCINEKCECNFGWKGTGCEVRDAGALAGLVVGILLGVGALVLLVLVVAVIVAVVIANKKKNARAAAAGGTSSYGTIASPSATASLLDNPAGGDNEGYQPLHDDGAYAETAPILGGNGSGSAAAANNNNNNNAVDSDSF